MADETQKDELGPKLDRFAELLDAFNEVLGEISGSLHYGVPVTREQAAQDRAEHDAEQKRRDQT